MWVHLYKRTADVVPGHISKEANKPVPIIPKTEQTYNLYGFVWALWLDCFPTFPLCEYVCYIAFSMILRLCLYCPEKQ